MPHQMISCFKGLAPVSVPSDWLEPAEDIQFAASGQVAYIRFGVGRAFSVRVHYDGPTVTPDVRRLSEDEEASVMWGDFCEPWESYKAVRLFGAGDPTKLDEIPAPAKESHTIPVPEYASFCARTMIGAIASTLEITESSGEEALATATVYPDAVGYAALGPRIRQHARTIDQALSDLGETLTLEIDGSTTD